MHIYAAAASGTTHAGSVQQPPDGDLAVLIAEQIAGPSSDSTNETRAPQDRARRSIAPIQPLACDRNAVPSIEPLCGNPMPAALVGKRTEDQIRVCGALHPFFDRIGVQVII